MSFDDLPIDLKNIVSEFAYFVKWKTVLKDLETCEKIKKMQLSSVFSREVMWSRMYREYIPNPLHTFEPICNYTGQWKDYVDWHAVEELLWRLDFRRKFVKNLYSRVQWFEKFGQSWCNIAAFDNFYRFLLCTRVPCFKPLYKPQGFSCLKSYRSPYISARWLLEC